MTEFQEHIPGPTNQVEPTSEELSFVDRHALHPLLFAFLSLVSILLLYQVGGGLLIFLVTGTASITRENVWGIRWLTLIGQMCFIFLPTLLFARLLAARLSGVFPFRVPGLRESTLALIALFSLQRVFEAYMFFQDRIPLPKLLHDLIEPIKKIA